MSFIIYDVNDDLHRYLVICTETLNMKSSDT